uniref:Uncharacterized protein n=1 Tax=Plectus sambesii TaxID=2011161 RepID=A0A914VY66_9BILA
MGAPRVKRQLAPSVDLERSLNKYDPDNLMRRLTTLNERIKCLLMMHNMRDADVLRMLKRRRRKRQLGPSVSLENMLEPVAKAFVNYDANC